jgi:hypothetical protein
MNGATGLFAFLEDGTLRVWDLLNRHRLLNCSLSSLLELEGYEVRLMWVEEGGTLAVVKVALLCDSSSAATQTIIICNLTLAQADGGHRPGQLTVEHTFSVNKV